MKKTKKDSEHLKWNPRWREGQLKGKKVDHKGKWVHIITEKPPSPGKPLTKVRSDGDLVQALKILGQAEALLKEKQLLPNVTELVSKALTLLTNYKDSGNKKG